MFDPRVCILHSFFFLFFFLAYFLQMQIDTRCILLILCNKNIILGFFMNIFTIPAFILLFVIDRMLFNICSYFLLHCWQYSKNHTNIYDEYPTLISDYRSSVLSFHAEERCNSVRISIHRDDSSVGMQPRLKGKWNTIGSTDRSENRNSLPVDPRRFAFLQGWIWNDRRDSVSWYYIKQTCLLWQITLKS